MLGEVTRMSGHADGRKRGFTLIEVLVTMAILAIIVVLTAPSAYDWIMIQRVKANASELLTDVRFARGEAIKRNARVVMAFKAVSGGEHCYSVHTQYYSEVRACDCTKGLGNACDKGSDPDNPELWDTLVELKTVSMPSSTNVVMTANRNASFLASNGMPATNANQFRVEFDGQNSRLLRVVTNAAGRPQICAPSGSRISGYPTC